jgi:NAD kinase
MISPAERKVVLVTRKTRLEELIARHHTASQARFYVEHLGADFDDYQREHDTYSHSLRSTVAVLAEHGRYHILDRTFLTNYLFAREDIVVALGQDGLVANTMKYLEGQVLVGLNPDASRYDGVLLPFNSGDLKLLLPDLLADRRHYKEVSMGKVSLSDKQALHAVNDLFIGSRTHTSARYEISHNDQREVHSSSGLIVSTGLGSTAWMRSVVTGSAAITNAALHHKICSDYAPLPWNADRLRFAVREPFPSKASQTNLVFGEIGRQQKLNLRSLMPENGVIFSDGIESDYLEFNSGTEATITLAEKRGKLIV